MQYIGLFPRIVSLFSPCYFLLEKLSKSLIPLSEGASPIRQPLQPEATGAVMEVTKWLKPSGVGFS